MIEHRATEFAALDLADIPELAVFDEQPLMVLREMVAFDSFIGLIENWFASLASRIERLVGAAATADLTKLTETAHDMAGTCGCFPLQGVAGDVYWNIAQLKPRHAADFGVAADLGVEHTGNENGAGYGLTLTTLSGGPRFKLRAKKVNTFAQLLLGFGHGSGSEFPEHGKLVSSASSFALDAGAGADYPVGEHVSIRMLQVDYLRLALPNNSTDWQNNLRLAAGVTFRFGR